MQVARHARSSTILRGLPGRASQLLEQNFHKQVKAMARKLDNKAREESAIKNIQMMGYALSPQPRGRGTEGLADFRHLTIWRVSQPSAETETNKTHPCREECSSVGCFATVRRSYTYLQCLKAPASGCFSYLTSSESAISCNTLDSTAHDMFVPFPCCQEMR